MKKLLIFFPFLLFASESKIGNLIVDTNDAIYSTAYEKGTYGISLWPDKLILSGMKGKRVKASCWIGKLGGKWQAYVRSKKRIRIQENQYQIPNPKVLKCFWRDSYLVDTFGKGIKKLAFYFGIYDGKKEVVGKQVVKEVNLQNRGVPPKKSELVMEPLPPDPGLPFEPFNLPEEKDLGYPRPYTGKWAFDQAYLANNPTGASIMSLMYVRGSDNLLLTDENNQLILWNPFTNKIQWKKVLGRKNEPAGLKILAASYKHDMLVACRDELHTTVNINLQIFSIKTGQKKREIAEKSRYKLKLHKDVRGTKMFCKSASFLFNDKYLLVYWTNAKSKYAVFDQRFTMYRTNDLKKVWDWQVYSKQDILEPAGFRAPVIFANLIPTESPNRFYYITSENIIYEITKKDMLAEQKVPDIHYKPNPGKMIGKLPFLSKYYSLKVITDGRTPDEWTLFFTEPYGTKSRILFVSKKDLSILYKSRVIYQASDLNVFGKRYMALNANGLVVWDMKTKKIVYRSIYKTSLPVMHPKKQEFILLDGSKKVKFFMPFPRKTLNISSEYKASNTYVKKGMRLKIWGTIPFEAYFKSGEVFYNSEYTAFQPNSDGYFRVFTIDSRQSYDVGFVGFMATLWKAFPNGGQLYFRGQGQAQIFWYGGFTKSQWQSSYGQIRKSLPTWNESPF